MSWIVYVLVAPWRSVSVTVKTVPTGLLCSTACCGTCVQLIPGQAVFPGASLLAGAGLHPHDPAAKPYTPPPCDCERHGQVIALDVLRDARELLRQCGYEPG